MSDTKVVNFFKGSAILIGANIIIKAINFFLLPLYTKYLSPDELGISDSVTNLSAIILPLLMMGLDSAFSAFYYDERTEEHKMKVINTTSVTLLIAGIVPFLIALFGRQISEILFHDDSYNMIVITSLVAISFNLWYTPYALYIRMENKMALFAAIQVTASFSMIVLNIVFVSVLHLGAYALVLSSAIIQALQFLLFTFGSRVQFKPKLSDKKLLKSMLKYSLPLVPTVIAAWFLNLSDRYMLLYFLSEHDVGIYGVAARFAGLLAVISNGVYIAYTSFAFDKKEDVDAKVQYKRVLSVYFIVLLLICALTSFWGREIIALMTDVKYAASYLLLPGLMFGQLLYGVSTIVGYGIAFAKKTVYTLIATLLAAVINVILNLLFIPRYGVEAATYTTFVSYFIMMLATYWLAQRVYKCDYGIGRIIISMGAAFAVSIVCVHLIENEIFKATVSIGLAFMVIVLFRDTIDDILMVMRKIIKKVKGRGISEGGE